MTALASKIPGTAQIPNSQLPYAEDAKVSQKTQKKPKKKEAKRWVPADLPFASSARLLRLLRSGVRFLAFWLSGFRIKPE
jgi:hypothetical protein